MSRKSQETIGPNVDIPAMTEFESAVPRVPDSKGVNVARFRPSQQKPAQLLVRCAVYSELCAEQRRRQRPSHRAVRELTNGKYGEHSNCYWCLARDRSGTGRSVPEARLQRSR